MTQEPTFIEGWAYLVDREGAALTGRVPAIFQQDAATGFYINAGNLTFPDLPADAAAITAIHLVDADGETHELPLHPQED